MNNEEQATKQEVQELRKMIQDLRTELEQAKDTIQHHSHSGNDGSSFVYNDGFSLKPGQQFATGNFSMAELTAAPAGSSEVVMRGFHIVGDDVNSTDGIDNAQLTLEHQPATDGSTNQTFYYGFRAPLILGDDGQLDGGSILKTAQYDFPLNGLVGAYLQVSRGSSVETYTITSNTKTEITVDGAYSFVGKNFSYIVFVPIYLGAADYPWRRVYVTSTDGGGVRFGEGDTAGGQNGLLYLDVASGRLKFRRPDGTVDII